MTLLYLKAVTDLMHNTKPEDWRKISAATGLKFAWLRHFARGEIDDPSVNKVETLHYHLTGKHFPGAD